MAEGRAGAGGVGRLASAVALVLLNVAGVCAVFFAYALMPDGERDRDMVDGAALCALLGGVTALVTALLTLIPVKARWLGHRWLVFALVLLALAVARYAYLDVVYDLGCDPAVNDGCA